MLCKSADEGHRNLPCPRSGTVSRPESDDILKAGTLYAGQNLQRIVKISAIYTVCMMVLLIQPPGRWYEYHGKNIAHARVPNRHDVILRSIALKSKLGRTLWFTSLGVYKSIAHLIIAAPRLSPTMTRETLRKKRARSVWRRRGYFVFSC